MGAVSLPGSSNCLRLTTRVPLWLFACDRFAMSLPRIFRASVANSTHNPGNLLLRNVVLPLDRLLTALSLHLACLLMVIISCLGLWQVIARFVLSQPSIWTEEVMRRLLIWCVMLGVVVAIRQGSLISVDLMLRRARGNWRQAVRAIVACTTLGFLGTIAWFGISLAWRVRFQTFASIDISIAWAYAAVPTGATLGMLATVANWLDEPIKEDPLDDVPLTSPAGSSPSSPINLGTGHAQ